MPRNESPDPLTLESTLDDCIIVAELATPVAGPSRAKSKPTPTTSTSTPSRSRTRVKPVIELPETPSKRRKTISTPSKNVETALTPKPKRTPLARASPAVNRASATKTNGSTRKGKEVASTPSKIVDDDSVLLPRTKATPRSTAKRKKEPTPPVIEPEDEEEDEEIGQRDEMDEAVSRETFLANEKLRRQREARNFKYTGSADAPKLTRSGRVIGEKEQEDEYGDSPQPAAPPVASRRENGLWDRRVVEIVPPVKVAEEELFPLPPGAKPYAKMMLEVLTGRGAATKPEPFAHEEKNEALNGLVNLLKGTVERGEGNSALIVGARGVGKTRTIARALNLLPSSSTNSPIVVRLSGLAQTNDRLAIREMGRQIAEAEGKMVAAEDDEEQAEEDADYAPTTLPSHLLALLTTPSPRAIVIIMEEFDLFTEHARQALLYCLLDVVQSVKTGPIASTGRGVAVIGVTSRIDTLLLLEKRVKSRFSHRMWRVVSPLAPDQLGWKEVLRRALIPWEYGAPPFEKETRETKEWKEDWAFATDTLIDHPKAIQSLNRLCSLTTDVRLLYLPFIAPMAEVVAGSLDILSVPILLADIVSQVEAASWGLASTKLKGLSHPAVGVLIIAKHLSYIGREEFTFAMVEEEYLRFARTKLVGSGRTRWPLTILRSGFDHLLRCGLLVSAGTGNIKPRFAKVRCTLAPHDIVAWMKGDGAVGLGPEMVGWGRLLGGHA